MAAFLDEDLLDHSSNLYLQKEQASRDHPVVIQTESLNLKN